jgi:hypothetical protein
MVLSKDVNLSILSVLSVLLKTEKVIVAIEDSSVDRMSSETQESIKVIGLGNSFVIARD